MTKGKSVQTLKGAPPDDFAFASEILEWLDAGPGGVRTLVTQETWDAAKEEEREKNGFLVVDKSKPWDLPGMFVNRTSSR